MGLKNLSIAASTAGINVAEHPFDEKALSMFQRILLATDGTVTTLISLYTGESIKITKIEQDFVSEYPDELGVADDETVLKRIILLSGKNPNYLFAEGFFVFERLSPSMQRKLLETDEPIGLLWKKEKIEMYRDVIEQHLEYSEEIARHFEVPPKTPILSRTYLILHKGRPYGIITEKFPVTHFADTAATSAQTTRVIPS